MIKFYLAARYPMRENMEEVSKEIEKTLGWKSNCSWVTKGEEGKTRAEIAILDLDEVESSDVFVLFTFPKGEPKPGGGRFVELGYALGKNKECIVVGNYENIFCHHPEVKVYPTLEDFILDRIIR